MPERSSSRNLSFEIRTLGRSLFLGYDFFISYAHSDGKEYARALQKRLESSDLVVFRDEEGIHGGDVLPIVIKAAASSSRRLIVVGSASALTRPWIQREIELFQRLNKPVIPIDLHNIRSRQSWFEDEVVYITEMSGNNEPSPEVVDTIIRGIKHWRVARIARALLYMAVVFFASLAAATGVISWVAVQERDRANYEKSVAQAGQLASDARWLLASRPDLVDVSTILAAASLQLVPTPEGRRSLRAALEALPPSPLRIDSPKRGEIRDLGFDKSGHRLLAVDESGPVLFEVSTGKEIWRRSRGVMSMRGVLSPDGSLVAVWNEGGDWYGVDEILDIWRVGGDTPLLQLRQGRFVTFSGDSQRLSYIDGEGVAHVLEALTGREIWRSSSGKAYSQFLLGEDGTAAVGAWGDKVEVFQISEAGGTSVFRATAPSTDPEFPISDLSINTNLRRVAAISTSVFTEWDYETGERLRSFTVENRKGALEKYPALKDHGVWSSGALAPSGQPTLRFTGESTAYYEDCRIWNLYHRSPVTAAVLGPAGLVGTGDKNGTLAVWRMPSLPLPPASPRISVRARLSRDGNWLVHRDDASLEIRSVGGSPEARLVSVKPAGSADSFEHAWVSPRGTLFAGIAPDGKLTVWNRATGKPVLVGGEHPMQVAFSGDESKFVAAYLFDEVVVYNQDGRAIQIIETTGNVVSLDVDSGGRTVALATWNPAGSKAQLLVVDLTAPGATFEENLNARNQEGLHVLFDDRNTLLFSADARGVQIRRREEGWKEADAIKSSDPVESLASAPGELLVVVTGPFTQRTSSIEARGASLIRVLRVTDRGETLDTEEVDRLEFGPGRAVIAADINPAGDWLHVVALERGEQGCGLSRIPWTNDTLLKVARVRLGGLPLLDSPPSSGTIEEMLDLRDQKRY